ncbi:RidA family protein [Loktanella sp. S4079]|uniref:RidA family protein n=1 Tax=Loktanella sp. S4079 TaxID=579483 RepID=UPI0005FA64DA|nr:RidA family protein [Loktanella sp. S4079]KJZ18423.1 endoribonuclease L-PSP [Loktanella sp. S4079]
MTYSIDRLNPNALPDASKVGYSQISIANPGRLAFVSGQVAWRADGTPAPDTLAEQTAIVVENLQSALAALQATPDEIVQMRIFIKDLNDDTIQVGMGPLLAFLDGAQPSLTGVGVAALASPELQIEVEMIVQMSI